MMAKANTTTFNAAIRAGANSYTGSEGSKVALCDGGSKHDYFQRCDQCCRLDMFQHDGNDNSSKYDYFQCYGQCRCEQLWGGHDYFQLCDQGCCREVILHDGSDNGT